MIRSLPSAFMVNISLLYGVNPLLISNVTSYDDPTYVNVDMCPSGSYSKGNYSTCNTCGSGTYSDHDANSMCGICPSGSFSVVNATTCINCTVGYGAYSQSSVCTECINNTIFVPGSPICLPCPGNSTSLKFMSPCQCVAGYEASVPNSTNLSCISCNPCYVDVTFVIRLIPNTFMVNANLIYAINPSLISNVNIYDAGYVIVDTCPLGSYSSANSTTCSLCGGGMYSDHDAKSMCDSCPSGRFSVVNATTCTTCAAGYESYVGSSVCTTCINNTFFLLGSPICLPCPGNSTSLGFTSPCQCFSGYEASVLNTSNFSCIPCNPGYISMQGGVCTACAAGTYQYGQACLPCTVWTYTSFTGATTCTTCNIGLISGIGATQCSACAQGTYADPASFLCSLCPMGTWGMGILYGVMQCTGCGAGKYSTILGLSTPSLCQQCPSGSFSSETKSGTVSNCRSCPIGFYSPSGSSSCSPCAPGSYSVGGQSSCIFCVQGKYQYYQGQSTCYNCSIGTVSDSGQSICTACVNGTYSVVSGAPLGSCIDCNAGQYSGSGSTVCFNCNSNQYSYTQAASCLSCPLFSVSPPASSLDKCTCNMGYSYNRISLVFTCQPCLPGSWSTNGSESCTPCQPGTSSVATAATSASTCLPCQSGFYSMSGWSSCLACTAGSFSAYNGSSTCTSCLLGTYSNAGASQCKTCILGMYIPYIGVDISDCIPCSAGTFQSQSGRTTCNNCVAGSYSDSGSTTCTLCGNNTFSDNSASSCTNCPLNSSSGIGSTASGCVCVTGFFPFYRTRAEGGFENVAILESGDIVREHMFTADGPLNVLVSTIISETCDGQVESTTRYFRGVLQVYLGPCSEVTFSYIINGEFYPNLSPTFFMCEICLPGSWSHPSDESCTDCFPGFYQPKYASSSCIHCSTGFVSVSPAAVECSECLHGTFEYNNTCQLCPPGYSSISGNTTCFACASDQYTVQGVGYCTDCPVNSSAVPAKGLDNCVCNAGYFRSFGVVDFCSPCDPGFFSYANETSCRICIETAYCPGSGPSIPCPFGTYSNVTGLLSVDQCAICPANYFCQSIADLEACPENTHSNTGSTSALECWCNTGYTCTYQKAVRVSVILPLTPIQFQSYESAFIASLAAAAGVPVGQVSIISSQLNPSRHLLFKRIALVNTTVEVHSKIHGIHRFGYSSLRLVHMGKQHSMLVTSRQDHRLTIKHSMWYI